MRPELYSDDVRVDASQECWPKSSSGGPVFRVIEQLDRPEKFVYYELVGIVYEIHESWEVVRARHIRHVLADGMLVPL